MNTVPWYDYLNGFDYALIGLMILSIIVSFFRGFVRELISLCVWAAGLLTAFKFAPLLEQHIHKITQWNMMSYVTAFMVIFISVWLVGLLFSLIMRTMTAGISLGVADRLLGLCFGVVRGGLVVAVLLMFVSMSPYKKDSFVMDSKIVPHFNRVVVLMDHYLPPDMQRLTHFAMSERNIRGGR